MNIEEVLKRWIGVTEDMARIIRELQARNDVLERMNAKQAETIRGMIANFEEMLNAKVSVAFEEFLDEPWVQKFGRATRPDTAPEWHGIPIDDPQDL